MSCFFRILKRRVTVLLFNNPTDENYSGSFQVTLIGDRGIVDTLKAEDFYNIISTCPEIFAALEVKSLEGPVKEAHGRLLEWKLRSSGVEIFDRGRCNVAGIDMRWIVVKLDERQTPRPEGDLDVRND